MNERIDELMIQAAARFEFLHGVHYDDFQYRKFAELIIQECIEIVQGCKCDCAEGIIEVGSALDTTVELIKEHFGVE